MWWTDDEQAKKNSVLRAISGGPVYVSDKIGRSRPEVFEPLCYSDGRILRCESPATPTLDCLTVDPEKSGVYFVDPWFEPYLYFYNTASTLNTETASWRGQGFILLSKGPDGKEKNVRSMYTTGIIPDMNDYQSEPENLDNIIQGIEE